MLKMATRLRFAFSATNKLVQSHKLLRPVQKSASLVNANFAVAERQLSNAVLSYRRFSPTLTGVKSCTPCKAPQRFLQTEVDKELSKFLEKEISYEESANSKSPQGPQGASAIEGFDMTTNGADVTLTRKAGNETVVVTFSVNDSIPFLESEEHVKNREGEEELMSRPRFMIELCKGDGRTLSLDCVFVSPEEVEPQGSPQDAETIVDTFEIENVALFEGERKEFNYNVSADIIDGNLYDLLMDMLDERGINEEFVKHLGNFSTSYEHGQYLAFLKNLKSFAEK